MGRPFSLRAIASVFLVLVACSNATVPNDDPQIDTPGRNGKEGSDACDDCQAGESCVDGICRAASRCTASSCDGCCKPDGTCAPGSTKDACGAAGNACEVCPDSSTCVERACSETCGPANCRGCCASDGTCVTGKQPNDRCGAVGNACETCKADEVCSPVLVPTADGTDYVQAGDCSPAACASCGTGCCLQVVGGGVTCQAGTDATFCGKAGTECKQCAADETCSNQACLPPPTTSFRLLLVNASLPPKNASGGDWDFLNPPDASIRVRLGTTPEKVGAYIAGSDDTFSPSFGLAVSIVATIAEFKKGISFDVVDRDGTNPDDIIGTVPATPYFPADVVFTTGGGGPYQLGTTTKVRFVFVRN